MTQPTPSLRAEVLRLLHQIGAMTIHDLQLCLPRYTRRQLRSAMSCLRAVDRVHIVDGHGTRHPSYALGMAGEARPAGMSLEDWLEHQYRQRLNPHLSEGWKPAPDVPFAWMFNPTQLEQELPCYVD